MKICILGKYPPIEGGVSTTTYWLARGLAERGHEVHVVTNGDEVEGMFRLSLEADDWPWYQPQFEESGGRVHVYNPDSFSRRAMGHIPEANPFVSKLASLATDVVRRHGCEAILAYYYEPYAVAGWLASRWTGRPLITKHAGSDLERFALGFEVPLPKVCQLARVARCGELGGSWEPPTASTCGSGSLTPTSAAKGARRTWRSSSPSRPTPS